MKPFIQKEIFDVYTQLCDFISWVCLKKQLSFFFIYNLNLQDTRVQKELTHKLDSYVMHKGKPERWLVLTLIKTFTFIHVFASVRKS